MSASNWIHLDVDEIVKETESAFLVRFEECEDEQIWLPKSQVANAGDYQMGDRYCTISITEWIAKEKGLV